MDLILRVPHPARSRLRIAGSGNQTPTTGSPVSRIEVQPYCGAKSRSSHGWTKLLTNGSSYHSETSWLKAWMSLKPRPGSLGSPKVPGEIIELNK